MKKSDKFLKLFVMILLLFLSIFCYIKFIHESWEFYNKHVKQHQKRGYMIDIQDDVKK